MKVLWTALSLLLAVLLVSCQDDPGDGFLKFESATGFDTNSPEPETDIGYIRNDPIIAEPEQEVPFESPIAEPDSSIVFLDDGMYRLTLEVVNELPEFEPDKSSTVQGKIRELLNTESFNFLPRAYRQDPKWGNVRQSKNSERGTINFALKLPEDHPHSYAQVQLEPT